MATTVEEGYKLYNERKFKEAFDALYDAAAYENNAEAQFYLGMMYRHGDGVEQNIDIAMKWWKKAVQKGHVDAAFHMSQIKVSTKHIF